MLLAVAVAVDIALATIEDQAAVAVAVVATVQFRQASLLKQTHRIPALLALAEKAKEPKKRPMEGNHHF